MLSIFLARMHPFVWRDLLPVRQLDYVHGRRVAAFAARYGVAIAEWPDAPVDPFFNINTPQDAAEAERLAVEHGLWRAQSG